MDAELDDSVPDVAGAVSPALDSDLRRLDLEQIAELLRNFGMGSRDALCKSTETEFKLVLQAVPESETDRVWELRKLRRCMIFAASCASEEESPDNVAQKMMLVAAVPSRALTLLLLQYAEEVCGLQAAYLILRNFKESGDVDWFSAAQAFAQCYDEVESALQLCIARGGTEAVQEAIRGHAIHVRNALVLICMCLVGHSDREALASMFAEAFRRTLNNDFESKLFNGYKHLMENVPGRFTTRSETRRRYRTRARPARPRPREALLPVQEVPQPEGGDQYQEAQGEDHQDQEEQDEGQQGERADGMLLATTPAASISAIDAVEANDDPVDGSAPRTWHQARCAPGTWHQERPSEVASGCSPPPADVVYYSEADGRNDPLFGCWIRKPFYDGISYVGQVTACGRQQYTGGQSAYLVDFGGGYSENMPAFEINSLFYYAAQSDAGGSRDHVESPCGLWPEDFNAGANSKRAHEESQVANASPLRVPVANLRASMESALAAVWSLKSNWQATPAPPDDEDDDDSMAGRITRWFSETDPILKDGLNRISLLERHIAVLRSGGEPQPAAATATSPAAASATSNAAATATSPESTTVTQAQLLAESEERNNG